MRTLHLIVLLTTTLFVQAQGWQWSKHIGGPGHDYGYIGGVDPAGHVYVYGNYARQIPSGPSAGCYFEEDTLTGTRDAFLAKYSADGSMVWLRDCRSTPGAYTIHDMVVDTNQGVFYTIGGFQGSVSMDTVIFTSAQYVGFISKWTLDGACLWVKPVSTSPISTTVFALTIDPQGQLMLAGTTGDLGPTQVGNEVLAPGSFLARCDTDGNVVWAKQLMAYGMQQSMFEIYALRNIGQDVVGYGQAYMYSEEDTIRVDDEYFTGGTGSAIGLVRLSTSTGQAQWLTLAGYPGAIVGPSASERIAINASGDIICIGPWYGSAVFATDTLVNSGSGVQSFLARFDGSGSETYLLDLRPTLGDLFSLNSVYIDSAGSHLLAAALAGSVDLCGSQLSSVGWGSLLMRLDPSGDCMIIDQTGAGVHATAIGTDHGIYAIGGFPAEGPTGSTNIGSDTYTTHGWSDIVLAKHDLPTSIAPKSAGDDRLLIYANPNQGSFRLVLPEALRYAPKLVLRVYDGTGRHLHEQVLERHEERPKVDVWNVSPGFYMVTVSDGKRTYSGNMVVE